MRLIKIYLFLLFITFFSFINTSCKKNPITPPIDPNKDTTSHLFNWQIDSIGIYPSNINGIWGTDINNVYAVGFIVYSYSPYSFTGIIHWDGIKWSSMDYHEGDLNDIYGFGENDIWAVGFWTIDNNAYALITHWDGNSWTTWKFQQYAGLWGVWGTSSDNLYAVGAGGLILHYNGIEWTEQSSSTIMSIVDIWGFDDSCIYATGIQSSTGSGVLLNFDGSAWKTVTVGGINPDSSTLYGDFESLWGLSAKKLFLVGALGYEGIPGNWKLSEIPFNSPGPHLNGLAAMEHVRGSAENNVFICGSRDLIIHWNGNTWNIYYQFFDKTKQSSLHALWVKDKNVFIGGYAEGLSKAIVYRGSQ